MIAYDNQILKLKKNTDYKVVWDKGVKKVSNNMILLYLLIWHLQRPHKKLRNFVTCKRNCLENIDIEYIIDI